MPVNTINRELIACFREKGFYLDYAITPAKASAVADKNFENQLYEKFLDNHNKMLFYLGFIAYLQDEFQKHTGSSFQPYAITGAVNPRYLSISRAMI